jgi:hypothetical protein
MLGVPGLRIFEATSGDITDLGEEHGHRVLRARQTLGIAEMSAWRAGDLR